MSVGVWSIEASCSFLVSAFHSKWVTDNVLLKPKTTAATLSKVFYLLYITNNSSKYQPHLRNLPQTFTEKLFKSSLIENWYKFPSVHSVPPTMPDQCFCLPLCLTVLSAQGVSRTTLMCGDTWQACWPLGLSLITLDPNPSGIKPAKPNSHCGSWLASAGTAVEGKAVASCVSANSAFVCFLHPHWFMCTDDNYFAV